jgi:MFS-type transporter involved in bile tolerance (Atg22 family)
VTRLPRTLSLQDTVASYTLLQRPDAPCLPEIFQNSAVSVYTSNLADIQTATRGTSKLAAGYNSSLQSVIPIVLTPVVGLFFDRFGWRMIFVSATAALYVVVFVLIGLTKVHPLAPILISSFALSSNALTFIAAIPVLVGDDSLLGTAFGVWKSFVSRARGFPIR